MPQMKVFEKTMQWFVNDLRNRESRKI